MLAVEPPSVVRKRVVPPSGDVHDYLSIGPYWWPNPGTPDGLPWVQRDGHYNPRTLDIPDKPGIYLLIDAVWVLGHAHHLLGEARFGARAGQLLRVWFLDPATRMNPNLNFGQSVPGRSDGRPAGLIETREIGKLLDGARLIEGSGAWRGAEAAGLRDWMREFLSWLSTSPLAAAERAAENNHATWYRAQAAAMLDFVGDTSAAAAMVAGGRELIGRHFEPDGRQPRELARANSRHYSLFNLLGFCRLAEMGDRLGVDLWTWRGATGASLVAGLRRLLADWDGWPAPTLPPMRDDAAEFGEVLFHAARRYGGTFQRRWEAEAAPDGLNRLLWPERGRRKAVARG